MQNAEEKVTSAECMHIHIPVLSDGRLTADTRHGDGDVCMQHHVSLLRGDITLACTHK